MNVLGRSLNCPSGNYARTVLKSFPPVLETFTNDKSNVSPVRNYSNYANIHPEILMRRFKEKDAQSLCSYLDSDDYKHHITLSVGENTAMKNEDTFSLDQYRFQHVPPIVEPKRKLGVKTSNKVDDVPKQPPRKKKKRVKIRTKILAVMLERKRALQRAEQDDQISIAPPSVKTRTITPVMLEKKKRIPIIMKKRVVPPLERKILENAMKVRKNIEKMSVKSDARTLRSTRSGDYRRMSSEAYHDDRSLLSSDTVNMKAFDKEGQVSQTELETKGNMPRHPKKTMCSSKSKYRFEKVSVLKPNTQMFLRGSGSPADRAPFRTISSPSFQGGQVNIPNMSSTPSLPTFVLSRRAYRVERPFKKSACQQIDEILRKRCKEANDMTCRSFDSGSVNSTDIENSILAFVCDEPCKLQKRKAEICIEQQEIDDFVNLKYKLDPIEFRQPYSPFNSPYHVAPKHQVRNNPAPSSISSYSEVENEIEKTPPASHNQKPLKVHAKEDCDHERWRHKSRYSKTECPGQKHKQKRECPKRDHVKKKKAKRPHSARSIYERICDKEKYLERNTPRPTPYMKREAVGSVSISRLMNSNCKQKIVLPLFKELLKKRKKMKKRNEEQGSLNLAAICIMTPQAARKEARKFKENQN